MLQFETKFVLHHSSPYKNMVSSELSDNELLLIIVKH